jgi:type IV pilus assembly protein PilF
MSVLRRLAVLGLAGLLAGCVTTRETVFTNPPSPDEAIQQRVQLARNYIGDGNWTDAKRNLKIAVEMDDRNAEIYEAFALIYQSTGEFELAEENYRRAIALDRDFSRARNNYAAFLFARERFEDAEKQLERVVKDTLYDARPQAYINLGLCRVALDKPQLAEEAFVRALAMDRRNRIALLELAQLRLAAGDYAGAGDYYTAYRTAVRQQSARGLWVGVRLAKATGDRDAEGSYGLALRNRYPDSPEYAAWQRQQDEAGAP